MTNVKIQEKNVLFALAFVNISNMFEKPYSCIGIRYAKLFGAAKIHFQIMRFACCLNMAFSLTKPIWALICSHDLPGVALRP